MDSVICSQCDKNKTVLSCGLCHQAVCKSCVEMLDSEAFAYDEALAAEFKHGAYCRPCFDEKLAPALAEYEERLEKARNVDIFFKKQGKETRLIRRMEKPVKIEKCPDRHELIMRLAYAAVCRGYESVIDIDLKSEKVRDGSYQKLIWRGSGVPAHTKGKVITTDKSIWDNPN